MATLAHHKVEKFGLEVPRSVTYSNWEPGREYTKSIVLKNVKIKTQKIKFKVTSNTFFSEVYPQPIILSAGNSYAIPITFRPKEKNSYEDNIEFQTSDGIFTVPLSASLPQPNLTIPESLQFGQCAVTGVINMDISITNLGSVPTDFHWECSSPFIIEPPAGTLNAKETYKLKVSFAPPSAKVYQVIAICHYGEKYHISKTMKLHATGKYPYVSVRCDNTNGENGILTVNFGDVPIGTIAEKDIHIHNMTPVPASFHLQPETVPKLIDNIFTFSQLKGTIPPLHTLPVKISYTPTYVGQTALIHYHLTTEGSLSHTRITCIGAPIGPSVTIDEDYINYGIIPCGQTASSVIHIRNTSITPTIYQLLLDSNGGIFHCESSSSGEINGQSMCCVTIHFTPLKPIPYHQVITCLLLNQEPLTFHVIGSAYTEKIRPVQLMPHHIRLYEMAAYSGLSRLSPEYLEQCILNGTLSVSEDDGSLLPSDMFEPSLHQLGSMIEHKSPSSGYYQYIHNTEPFKSSHVSIDQEYLDFGYTQYKRSSEKKFITVTNNTEGTLYCSWMAETGDTFQIIPIERDISPNSTVAFTVTFWPDKPNHLFSKQLECYLFYKILRDYSLIDTRVVILPWCLQVTALGHSFSPGTEPYLPTLSFNTRNVTFPTAVGGQTVYKTLVGKNCGETPVMYQFTPDPSNVTFHIKPNCGVIEDTYQLFVLSMTPRHPQLYEQIVNCNMNNCPDFNQELLLSGLAEIPNVILEKGQIFFKPTPVAGYSIVKCMITNPCGISIRFMWQYKSSDGKVLSIVPSSGVIEPRGSLNVTFMFSPREEKSYVIKIMIVSYFNGFDLEKSNQKNKSVLMCYGQGSTGEINCNISHLQCDPIAVGTSMRQSLILSNDSNCCLKFKLGISQTIEGADGSKEEIPISHNPRGLQLNLTEDDINSYSKKYITISLRPSYPSTIKSKLFYQLVSPDLTVSQWLPLCDITYQSFYPTLSIINVQSDEMASSLTKSQIWKMLQIDRMNYCLQQDPSPDELRYAVLTRHSITRQVPVLTRAILNFNFGAAPIGCDKKSIFYMLISNPSPIPAQWAFQFPMDMYLEPPYWSETGQLTSIEQHEQDVVNNNLFTVSPKRGKLNAGEKIIIKCSYVHSKLGTSSLPVLLKINRGREILLNFTGLTSPAHAPCITCLSPIHIFIPVPIKTESYPIQYFELINSGDTMGSYVIDISPLNDLTKANSDMVILDCIKPQGELPPRQTSLVPFVFSPREAKVYSVDLSIHFSNGHVSAVTFQGEGLVSIDDNGGDTTSGGDNYISLESEAQNIPEHSELTLPGQLVELSQERINLGHTPLFSIVRRMIFLKNTSKFTTSFQWKLQEHFAKDWYFSNTDTSETIQSDQSMSLLRGSTVYELQVLSILPESGYLQPDQVAACRVTFHSPSSPTIYDIDILCQIVNESEMIIYNENLKKLEEEKEHEKTCFAIVDPKKKKKKVVGQGTYDKWKKKDLSVRSKTRARQREEAQAALTTLQSPPPQYIQFGVTAQTHTISDYCKHFKSFGNFSIDHRSLLSSSKFKERQGTIAFANEEEQLMMSNISGEILKELLTDDNFLTSIQCVTEEPIPYFIQLTTLHQPEIDETTSTIATRHVYAAALQQVPSLADINGGSPPSSQHVMDDKLAVEDGSDISIGLPETSQHLAALTSHDKVGFKIKHDPEFRSLSEKLTENILFNIIREALAGELNLTAPVFTIAKPP